MNDLEKREDWTKPAERHQKGSKQKLCARRKVELIEMAKRYKAENDCTFAEAKKVVGA